MKKYILLIGSLVLVILTVLWLFNIVSEPIPAIGSAILTLVGYYLTLLAEYNKKNNKRELKEDQIESRDVTVYKTFHFDLKLKLVLLISIGVILYFVNDIFRSFFFYILISIISYWYILIIFTVLLKKYKKHYVFLSWTFFSVILLLSLFIDVFNFDSNKHRIVYSGIYNINSEEKIFSNGNNSIINDFDLQFDQILKSIHINFYNGKLSYVNKVLPEFLPMLLGLKLTENLIQKSNNRNAINFYFLVDNNGSVNIRIIANAKFFRDNYELELLEQELNSISVKLKSSDFVKFSFYQLFATIGQADIHYYFQSKDYNFAHLILEDSDRMIEFSIEEIKTRYPIEIYQNINEIFSYFKANIIRQKAIAFALQGQNLYAINAIFEAINLSPYFPCISYIKFKEEFTYKYLISVGAAQEQFGNNTYKSLQSNKLDRSFDYPFNYELFHNYNLFDDTENTIIIEKLIKEYLNKNKNNPISWFYFGELIKFIPRDDTAKINEVYVQRLNESISSFEKCIKLDPDFKVINFKIFANRFLLDVSKGKSADEIIASNTYPKYLEKVKELIAQFGENQTQSMQ